MSEHARPDRSAPPRLTSYEDECEAYAVAVPERFNPVIDIIDRWAAEAPDDLALISLGPQGEMVAEHTAAQLAAESRRTARALLELGVRKGDPVFIMLPRVPAWYAAMLGAIRIGAVVMPGTNQLTARDIAYRVNAADATVAITSADGAEKIDAIDADMPSLGTRIAWGAGEREGWHDFDALLDEAGDGEVPESPTSREDPMIL